MKKIFQISIFLFSSFVQNFGSNFFENLTRDYLDLIDKTAYNINTKTIQYSLTYQKSILKVLIKTEEKITQKVAFVAFLRSENSKQEHQLKCSYPHEDIIECKTKSGLQLDTNDRYHIYYNRSKKEKLIFDYQNIMEDDKKISLIFKPDLYVNQTVYLDNKKIMAQINRKCVAGGYLYIINKRKGVQNIPKDGLNRYFELNNFIYQPDYNSNNLLNIYKEAIKKGFHMIETEIVFTKDNIPVIYNGKNNIGNYNQDLLRFNDLLKLCRNNEVILDIKFDYLNINSEKNDLKDTIRTILEEIEKNKLLNSVIINDDIKNLEIISNIINLKKDIPISISIINEKQDLDLKNIESYLNNFNHIIIEVDSNVAESTLNYIRSLNYKIKFFNKINSKEFSVRLTSFGVNYIPTTNLEPFLIHNDKDFPMRVKCEPIFMDDLSECKMGNEHILRDNEFYNIHYSTNIYNKSLDINETAIGEFRFEDTKINDMRYYVIKELNFENGIIVLITSDKIPQGKIVGGIVGPNYDNVADAYIFEFICEGSGLNFLNCEIEKSKDKIEYDGEYVIYKFDNYSFNEEEIEDFDLMKLKYKHLYSTKEKIIYTFLIIIISFFSFYYLQCYQNNYIGISDGNYN